MAKKTYFILAILIGLIPLLSLFKSGLLPTHDGEYHIIRTYEFNKALEGEIIYIKKLEGKEKEKVSQQMAEIEKKRAELEPPEFLIKSKILPIPTFPKAERQIRGPAGLAPLRRGFLKNIPCKVNYALPYLYFPAALCYKYAF